jgi:ATP-dependent RNA helicase DDX23/PRP28
MIGIAPTGMGKSCAFLTPLINFLTTLPPIKYNIDDGPYSIILVPTRELAIQLEKEFIKLSKNTSLTSACVIGGRSALEQSNKIT